MRYILKVTLVAAFLFGTVPTVLNQSIVGEAHAMDQKGLRHALDMLSKKTDEEMKKVKEEMFKEMKLEVPKISDPSKKERKMQNVFEKYRKKMDSIHARFAKEHENIYKKFVKLK